MKIPKESPAGNQVSESPNMMEAALQYTEQAYPVLSVHSPNPKGGGSCGHDNCYSETSQADAAINSENDQRMLRED